MKTRHKLLSLFTLITTSFIGTCAINTFIKVRAHSKHLMHSDTSLYYKWRLGKIHYTKTGQGSPLLLLHDLCPASSGCEWERILSSLSKKFTVYVPDLIGFGRSEKPDITYTNPLFMQLISDFIQSEIGRRTHVVTTGETACAVITACKNNPDLFANLVFISPKSPEEEMKIPGKRAKSYKFILQLPMLGNLLYNIAYSKKNIDREVEENFYHPYAVPVLLKDIYYESAHRGDFPRSVHSSIICNYTKFNIKPALACIDHSIALIAGENDSDGVSAIASMVQINPSIESAILPKCKRLPQLELPRELLQLLNIYL